MASTSTPATLDLTWAPAFADLGDGVARWVWAYNGRFPGPTWEARRGDTVSVSLSNGLNEPTITHWHGLHVDYDNDGGPRLAIGPNEFYDYEFKIIQRASLNFHHPHAHMLTGKQVCLGLAGAFGHSSSGTPRGMHLGLPADSYEVPLVIRDASFGL